MPSTTNQAPPKLFRTWEAIEWLRDHLDVSEELGEAFLGGWVGAIRYATRTRAGRDPLFLDHLNQGAAEMLLSAGLAPPGWQDEDLRAQVTLHTGLPDDAGRQLLDEMANKLRDIEGCLFEPLGTFSTRQDGQPGFLLHFLPDFLEPILDEPGDLGEEAIVPDGGLNGGLSQKC